ncbi:ATP-binding cassette domain-containing protein [candidate division KSB3 bacterium]|uniref:ATP-binding cassette domain-containing protein n=1 Tax=candidate division KSB3 bacterium TaxID=2044937 RepID=A0A9D5Q6Z4_9BACT|nr:ATP-binding cassette domain-containing protein [candidate division KSB3 bacterium]MBD3325888.1 ATP-binding cassette domain-containing protein [candidate division KSB3 bacterium]
MLKIEGLNVFYGETQALRDVSLTIDEGEMITVIGANGAGKTTLLKKIIGLIPAQSGTITYFDEEITSLYAHEIVRRGIALCPAGRQIFEYMTVKENLRMGAFIRKDGEKAVDQTMERLFDIFPRLKEREGQTGGSLSGGEQQMLAIARALMLEPKLLLVDELSMGLAPLLVKGLFEKLQDIQAKGTTILLVEQNARLALNVADRGYVLRNGHIWLSGTCQELKNDDRVRSAYVG